MKKLKLFLMMLIAAVGVCNFVSCDKDDDKGGASSIVGTWEDRDEYGYDRYTFSSNGSYTWVVEEYDKGGSTDIEYGTYTYDGKHLTLRDSYGYTDTFDVVISGNKMTWYVEGEEPCVYTRK